MAVNDAVGAGYMRLQQLLKLNIMKKSLFVVTYPENGWDCVGQIFKAESEEDVKNYFRKGGRSEDYIENSIIIHEKYDIKEL